MNNKPKNVQLIIQSISLLSLYITIKLLDNYTENKM